MMNDLTHNYKRKETNLSVAKTSEALKILKKTRMPASFIKNEAIKKNIKIWTPRASCHHLQTTSAVVLEQAVIVIQK